MDIEEKFLSLTEKATRAEWDKSIPLQHRLILEGCLASSSLNRQDLAVLYEFIGKQRPRRVIEVGLATGSSAVCNILAAQSSIESYVAVDPCQKSAFHNKGIEALQSNAHPDTTISLQEAFSYVALPRLLAENYTFDYAFIDASHMFDATLIEFFYIDKMLEDGGIVILDDRPWPMVGAVVNFIRENYVHYCLDSRHPRLTFLLKKHGDRRKWYDFRHFEVPRSEIFAEKIATLQRKKGSAFTAK